MFVNENPHYKEFFLYVKIIGISDFTTAQKKKGFQL
jgi:hypothetical protein